MSNIEKLDPNLASAGAGDGLQWYDIRHLGLEGKGWDEGGPFFARFPERAKATVPPSVWELSGHSAGMAVRFVTAATKLSVRWTLKHDGLAMPHMPATGVSGVDLYLRHGGGWRWVATGVAREKTNSQGLVGDLEPGVNREYRMYLPLYNGVLSVELGVPAGETLSKAPPAEGKPICYYGSSIAQGGCASRPGMAYTAIASRCLDRTHYNFGFSGNARMEPALAEMLAELDPSVYVLDAFPNMDAAQVRERFANFVRILRKAHPDTPIVVMENLTYMGLDLNAARRKFLDDKNTAAREVMQALHKEGVTRLTHVPGDIQLGPDAEGTVDGVHPTDLGFTIMAKAIVPFLKPLV